jgi:hypothetical protein
MATMGIGAVAGAVGLPTIRRVCAPDRGTTLSTAAFGLAVVGIALAIPQGSVITIGLVLPMAGGGWIVTLSYLGVAAQGSEANWVKARALALYLVVAAGAAGLGSAIWGALAETVGITATLMLAAAGLVLGLLAIRRFPLADAGTLDLLPASVQSTPVDYADGDVGPVLVEIEYEVPFQNEEAFNLVIDAMRHSRLRTGAYAWALLHDHDRPTCHREQFWVGSWLEHLRQRRLHETAFDVELHRRVRALAVSDPGPTGRHFVPEGRAPRRHQTTGKT